MVPRILLKPWKNEKDVYTAELFVKGGSIVYESKKSSTAAFRKAFHALRVAQKAREANDNDVSTSE